MASVAARRSLALVLLGIAVSVTGVVSKSFNIMNNCSYTVWPAISSAASSVAPDTTGFELAPGQLEMVPVPLGWAGRVWGRTLCSTDSSGKFTCVTGDCGSGRHDCAGGNAVPPVTLAQFTMDDGSGGMDFYDISLVDGYNLPMLVAPQGAAPGGNCTPTGCVVDLNGECPAELRVMSSAAAGFVACKSACLAFGSPKYCCTGKYGNPGTCKPSAYSQFFKQVCPRAYSYAYDGAGSTFSCAGGDNTYAIIFCPSTTSGAKSNSQPPPPGDQPHVDVTVVANTGGNQFPAWGVVAGALSVLAPVLSVVFGCFKYIMKKRRAQGAGAAGES